MSEGFEKDWQGWDNRAEIKHSETWVQAASVGGIMLGSCAAIPATRETFISVSLPLDVLEGMLQDARRNGSESLCIEARRTEEGGKPIAEPVPPADRVMREDQDNSDIWEGPCVAIYGFNCSGRERITHYEGPGGCCCASGVCNQKTNKDGKGGS